MKLNDISKSQLVVLWSAITIIVISFLYPPWKVGMGTYGRSYSEGYAFIVSPPHRAVAIDMQRVFLQAAAVALIAYGALVSMGRARGNRPSSVGTALKLAKWLNCIRYGWLCLSVLIVGAEVILLTHIPKYAVKYDWTGATIVALFMALYQALPNAWRKDRPDTRRQLILVVVLAGCGFGFSFAKDQWDKLMVTQGQRPPVSSVSPARD